MPQAHCTDAFSPLCYHSSSPPFLGGNRQRPGRKLSVEAYVFYLIFFLSHFFFSFECFSFFLAISLFDICPGRFLYHPHHHFHHQYHRSLGELVAASSPDLVKKKKEKEKKKPILGCSCCPDANFGRKDFVFESNLKGEAEEKKDLSHRKRADGGK